MPAVQPSDLPIEVRRSAVHGWGAFASKLHKRGALVGRYTGRLYSPGEVGRRDWDPTLTFVFGLSDGSVIDGVEGGNDTRHINHSCHPNCIAYEVACEDGGSRIEIEALRTIRPGEEFFLDYGLDAGEGTADDFPCRCGAQACRGTLVAPTP